MVLRRQWSRFTLLIQSILCWRGVAKQPQGNEWDSNSGDLELRCEYRRCLAAYIICNFFSRFCQGFIVYGVNRQTPQWAGKTQDDNLD